jgi:hypothetical protein
MKISILSRQRKSEPSRARALRAARQQKFLGGGIVGAERRHFSGRQQTKNEQKV